MEQINGIETVVDNLFLLQLHVGIFQILYGSQPLIIPLPIQIKLFSPAARSPRAALAFTLELLGWRQLHAESGEREGGGLDL